MQPGCPYPVLYTVLFSVHSYQVLRFDEVDNYMSQTAEVLVDYFCWRCIRGQSQTPSNKSTK